MGAADSGGGDHRKEGKMVKLCQAGKARERHSRWKVWQKQRWGDGEMHSARGADSTWRRIMGVEDTKVSRGQI